MGVADGGKRRLLLLARLRLLVVIGVAQMVYTFAVVVLVVMILPGPIIVTMIAL